MIDKEQEIQKALDNVMHAKVYLEHLKAIAHLHNNDVEYLTYLLSENERLHVEVNNISEDWISMEKKLNQAVEALEWYADDDNWTRTILRHGTEWLEAGPANADDGERARNTLSILREDGSSYGQD